MKKRRVEPDLPMIHTVRRQKVVLDDAPEVDEDAKPKIGFHRGNR